jgi:ribulose-phosphate 3-epimerase
MPVTITPCITAETIEAYKSQIERLQPFASRVHIDISDGEFAPSLLVTENELYWPPQWQVDVHMMVNRPTEHLSRLFVLKPSLIIIHAEIEENLVATLQVIKESGIRAGVALQRSTVPSSVAGAIEIADHVMIFSGDLGKYGGQASMLQIEKVRLIRAINPGVEIGWDGGANVDNAYTLTKGGISVINVGGAIANAEDPQAMYVRLTQEISKQGVL